MYFLVSKYDLLRKEILYIKRRTFLCDNNNRVFSGNSAIPFKGKCLTYVKLYEERKKDSFQRVKFN